MDKIPKELKQLLKDQPEVLPARRTTRLVSLPTTPRDIQSKPQKSSNNRKVSAQQPKMPNLPAKSTTLSPHEHNELPNQRIQKAKEKQQKLSKPPGDKIPNELKQLFKGQPEVLPVRRTTRLSSLSSTLRDNQPERQKSNNNRKASAQQPKMSNMPAKSSKSILPKVQLNNLTSKDVNDIQRMVDNEIKRSIRILDEKVSLIDAKLDKLFLMVEAYEKNVRKIASMKKK